MQDIFWTLIVWYALLSILNWDDDFARYLGQFAAEVVKGFGAGGL